MANINGRPFSDVLGEVRDGALLEELTASLYEVMQAVLDTRKVGGIKLNMKITPTGRDTVQVDVKFDADKPEHVRPSTTFFVGNDGSLHRNDPRQARLPLQEVEIPRNAPIEVQG